MNESKKKKKNERPIVTAQIATTINIIYAFLNYFYLLIFLAFDVSLSISINKYLAFQVIEKVINNNKKKQTKNKKTKLSFLIFSFQIFMGNKFKKIWNKHKIVLDMSEIISNFHLPFNYFCFPFFNINLKIFNNNNNQQ